MGDVLEAASLDAVKLPGQLVRALSIARENGLESPLVVEMTPPTAAAAAAAAALTIDYLSRWRRACLILHTVFAFTQARGPDDDAAAAAAPDNNRNEMLENLLQPPEEDQDQEVVIDIPSDCLSHLASSKNQAQLDRLGGIAGVASSLGTDADNGIQGDDEDLARRRLNYGSNTISDLSPKVCHVLLETIGDPIVIVLQLCAILALGFGIKHHGKGGLSDGVSICSALIIVTIVTAFSNLWPKLQLFELSKAWNEFHVSVLRNGQTMSISVFDTVVGDVVFLKTGDQVPADGLYIDGNSLQMDESNIRPLTVVSVEGNDSHNPFLLSGTKVISGSARMLVTAVGPNTEWWKMLSLKLCPPDHSTPLQKRLRELAKLIAKIGSIVASIVLLVLLIRYFVGNLHDDSGKPHFEAGKTRGPEVVEDMIGILATPIAIAATAFAEGLQLAVSISIAFSARMMKALKALVTNLSACEAIGTATVICTDERCNLTQNHLAVTESCFCNKHFNKEPAVLGISTNVSELLLQAVFLSHAEDSPDSQIKDAIQTWAVKNLGLDIDQVKEHYTIHLPQTSNSENAQTDNSLHVHQKGEPEVIVPKCSHYYDENGNIEHMDNSLRINLEQIVRRMRSKGLQCIAFAHKKMPEESNDEDRTFNPKLKEECLIFIGVIGMTYPCRPEVRKAIDDCKKAGVDIRLVTRNDLSTARATAIECGILEANEDINTAQVVDGQEFENYTDNEIHEKCLGIRVMARASNANKIRLVQCLKKKGEVVAVTGDPTEDADVLKEADVGLSLGARRTRQVMENSNVIIIEDNFDSLARVLTWGRDMYHKIQLYAQFQLTVSISSLAIDFVTAISAREPTTFKIVTAVSSGKVPYATLQVLWVKLIVGTLAAVAITVEEPNEELQKFKRDQPFISSTMWKNIIGQAVYPIITLLTIQFRGQSTFNLDSGAKDTMIFNSFVLWQLYFMLYIKGNERNIIWRRKLLWCITGFISLVQVVIVELLCKFADTKPLTWIQWMVCVGIAVVAWPIGWLIGKIKCSSEAFFHHG